MQNYPNMLDVARFLKLYRDMSTARAVDESEAEFVSRGEAFFHVSGRGHEGSAVLTHYLGSHDYLHCHYRDKALLIARGVSPKSYLDSLFCNDAGHSRGRQMSAHMSDPDLRVLSTVGPVGNHALQAVGVAAETKHEVGSPIVLCSVGDGTTQQGEFLEAIAESVRSQLRVLFWIADNQFAISTPTARKTFYDRPDGRPSSFYGIPIVEMDGTDVVACDDSVRNVVERMRMNSGPAIVLFRVQRLCNHTNADDEKVYRTTTDIEHARAFSDPIKNLHKRLLESDVSASTLAAIDEEVEQTVRTAAESALTSPRPAPMRSAKRPLPEITRETESNVDQTIGEIGAHQTMMEAMRSVLRNRLETDSRVSIYGQDIEDPKGDVFGLTRGLSTSFPDRVCNSPLSESTILGVSIGRALAGGRPVACIQFADFLPLAWNQLATELGSMYWRTDGGWESPVVLLVPCGGYRPGLGPFHANTWESSLTHIPGIDVLMPSSAADAAGLLHAALESGRPTVFLYPKVCLNDPSRATNKNLEVHRTRIGKARFLNRGKDLTIVTWGSTVPLCEQVAEVLQRSENIAEGPLCSVDLIDLRSLSPWDRGTVVASVRRTRNLLVVHEDNLTCGFGAEVVATATEQAGVGVRCRRIARPDTYVPCNFDNQKAILPSFKSVLGAACDLLSIRLSWKKESKTSEKSVLLVRAQGTSPADQTVTIIDWAINQQDRVEAGQVVGIAEADKASFDLKCPVAGVVEQLLVPPGDTVRVGDPILKVNPVANATDRRSQGESWIHKPALKRDASLNRRGAALAGRGWREPSSSLSTITLSRPYCVTGSGKVGNQQILERFDNRTSEEIIRLTGIEQRCQIAPNQTVIDLAINAVKLAFEEESIQLSDIDAIVCSTTTPLAVCPSMACSLLSALSADAPREIPCHDVNAACAGYLYALGSGADFLRAGSARNVLVVTADALSSVVNPNDFDTCILFGDAASATILSKEVESFAERNPRRRTPNLTRVLRRPVLSAAADKSSALHVPFPSNGYVEMRGNRVFGKAVRKMAAMLETACDDASISIEELDWVVPHQANGRILTALRSRLPIEDWRIVDAIANTGNTSSTSIPLALQKLEPRIESGQLIGLCAFGGGFVFGASILEVHGS